MSWINVISFFIANGSAPVGGCLSNQMLLAMSCLFEVSFVLLCSNYVQDALG